MRCIFRQAVTAPVRIVTVPFVHVWTIPYGPLSALLFLEVLFFLPWIYLQCWNCNRFMWTFRKITYFSIYLCFLWHVCLQLSILLIGGIMSRLKTNWSRLFLKSGGTYSVPQNLLPLGCPSMGQRHLHKFTVYYKYVQDSLLIDEFFIWLRFPVDSLTK